MRELLRSEAFFLRWADGLSWPSAIEFTKSLRCGWLAVCVQHMCMFKWTCIEFSDLNSPLIRDFLTLQLFLNGSFQCFTVFQQ